MTSVNFSVSGTQLYGNLFIPDKPLSSHPAVLFIHGWTSRQSVYFGYATALAELGYICMTFDMRGHETSGGDIRALSRNDFLDDAIQAFDVLSNTKGVDRARISVVGSSFGSYLATLLCSKRNCRSVALRVPANYPDIGSDSPHYKKALAYYEGLKDNEILKWKSTVHPYVETASLRSLHEFAGPVLIVESEKDELVPPQMIQSYCDAVADPSKLTYIRMIGAPHSISKDEKRKNEFATILAQWLTKQYSNE